MSFGMLCNIEQLKVAELIIDLVAIYVMNVLLSCELSAEKDFHDEPVFADILIVIACSVGVEDYYIAVTGYMSARVVMGVEFPASTRHRVANSHGMVVDIIGDSACVVMSLDDNKFVASTIT